MRGEYRAAASASFAFLELPPRARRIPPVDIPRSSPAGTTSACAENKLLRIFPPPPGRNYLRVRGEYKPPAEDRAWHPELPPRARRIHHRTQPYYVGLGTTSACAENTTNSRERQKAARNYLRVRGEYMGDAYQLAQALELPPRARRIHQLIQQAVSEGGTTSACAENTLGTP